MILTGETEELEKTLLYATFLHHISHTDWSGIEPGNVR